MLGLKCTSNNHQLNLSTHVMGSQNSAFIPDIDPAGENSDVIIEDYDD
jgi:hypothetical protein